MPQPAHPSHTPHAKLRHALKRHAHAVERMREHAEALQAERDQEREQLQQLIAQELQNTETPAPSEGQAPTGSP